MTARKIADRFVRPIGLGARDSLRLEAGLPRVHRALRPGGWLIVLAHEMPDTDPLAAAARRFRARVWGGGVYESDTFYRVSPEGTSAAAAVRPVRG